MSCEGAETKTALLGNTCRIAAAEFTFTAAESPLKLAHALTLCLERVNFNVDNLLSLWLVS